MNHIIVNDKHTDLAQAASAERLIRYSELPEIDVMPISPEDLVSPTVGYCALSLCAGNDDVYDLVEMVGFVTQKGTIEYDGVIYDQIRHLTLLKEWQRIGLATKLVYRTASSMIEGGALNLAAIVNSVGRLPFEANGFEFAKSTVGQTGVMKALYILQDGKLKCKKVE